MSHNVVPLYIKTSKFLSTKVTGLNFNNTILYNKSIDILILYISETYSGFNLTFQKMIREFFYRK